MSVFFDTNVLVYVFDSAEPSKQARAQELLGSHTRARDMVLSTQVLQELYVTLTRKKRLGLADALEVVTTLTQAARVTATSADMVLRALTLSQQRQISAWDALILQAALDADCATLYSEDFQNGARFGELLVVNPFATQLHEPPSVYLLKSVAKRGKKVAGCG